MTFVALLVLYCVLLVANSRDNLPMATQDLDPLRHKTVMLFGATGTIGEGLLLAALQDPQVSQLHVVTRRMTPTIEQGATDGKLKVTIHKDYLDYAAIAGLLTETDAVYWAIGLSAVGLEEAKYREIHRDYPMRFMSEWLRAGGSRQRSFHYVSGAGAKSGSRMMWAREKALAERDLAALASGTDVRVLSYRPSIIRPTETERHLGHRLLYALFAPIGLAVDAQAIGQAMLEVSARGEQYPSGTILENADIRALGAAYAQRLSGKGE
ncbi:MAG: hypothetical protein AAGA23_11665 [Pseudomonadota bacterium]